MLIAESPKGMQWRLDALHTLSLDSGLSVNLGKTKAVVFNTTARWVRGSAPAFKYGEETMEYVDSTPSWSPKF